MALTCEAHTAFLYDRGGKRQIGKIEPLSHVKWERKRDDVSVATVHATAVSADCSRALGLIEAGRGELVIFRGRRRVWEGPITRVSYQKDNVEIEARDVAHYAVRTIMRHEYDNRHPRTVRVLDRLKRIIPAELSRKEALDPPINVVAHVQYIYEAGSRTYERAYYDAQPVKLALGEAKSIAAMEAAMDPIQGDYTFTSLGVPPHNSELDISWLNARLEDWQLKIYMRTFASAMEKYPPSFISASGIEKIWFVRDISNGSGFNVGGAAAAQTVWLDIKDYNTDAGVLFNSEHVIHHELNHLMLDKYGAALILERWAALNPAGFQYGTPGDIHQVRPAGFLRGYGKVSFGEDLADIVGAMFSDSMEAFLSEAVESDAIVAGKVALALEWLGAISAGVIDSQLYFDALHFGTIVTPGENGATDARTAAHTLPYEMTLFEHFDNYAARGGVDYTVVGRSILFFDVHQRIGQTAMVTAEDFIGDPIITQYGMELATYVAHTDGKGHWGEAGGTDPYYGEWEILHQAYDENAGPADSNQVPSVAELTSQAVRTHKQGARPPLVVRVPDNTRLNPNGVLTIEDLVPGVWIPLSATLPGRTVSQMQKLDSMTVEETAENGEEIKVTLSPAYTESFVEDEAG